MERVENLAKYAWVGEEAKEKLDEKLEAVSPDQIEISEKPKVDGLDYHADFDGFAKTL